MSFSLYLAFFDVFDKISAISVEKRINKILRNGSTNVSFFVRF